MTFALASNCLKNVVSPAFVTAKDYGPKNYYTLPYGFYCVQIIIRIFRDFNICVIVNIFFRSMYLKSSTVICTASLISDDFFLAEIDNLIDYG